MFIVLLTYKEPMSTVDKYLNLHVEYLKEQYKEGQFIASGRKVPRTGGVILSQIVDRDILNKVIDMDPFKINNVAEYEVVEFIPSMTCEDLTFLIPK